MIFPRAGGLFPSVGRASGMIPGLSGVPKISFGVSTKFFFDKAAVTSALTNMERAGLSKSSLLVRRTAQKSIQKQGYAKPPLKAMKQNPGVPLDALLKLPGLSSSSRRAINVRLLEIQRKSGSPAGTPPFTWVPYSHMLGFRRNLYNAMDPSMKSAVVGPTAKGPDPGLPALHEFGGKRIIQAYIYEPSDKQKQAWNRHKAKYITTLVRWASPSKPPGGRWVAWSGVTKTAVYPERPFMRPALATCLPMIAKMFEGKFSTRVIR